MVKNNKPKFAFTIAEMVSTIIITVILVYVLTIVAKKLLPYIEIYNGNLKGTFACYYDECDKNNKNCKLKQTIHDGKTIKDDKDVTEQGYCIFEPVKQKKYMYIIYIYCISNVYCVIS